MILTLNIIYNFIILMYILNDLHIYKKKLRLSNNYIQVIV